MRGKTTEDLIGKQFGKWKVIKRDSEYRSNAYWVCRCECGLEKPVNSSHLRLGKSISCRRCSEHKHKGKICSRIWSRLRYNSKKGHNRQVDLGEPEDAKKFLYELLFKKQKCICALSGLPIIIATTIEGDKHGGTTASLDRIDSSKGYTRDNVQWVHKWINFMKQDFTQEEFITFCVAVAKHKGMLIE